MNIIDWWKKNKDPKYTPPVHPPTLPENPCPVCGKGNLDILQELFKEPEESGLLALLGTYLTPVIAFITLVIVMFKK